MKASSKKKFSYLLLVALAAVLLLSSVSGICYAYFTTYVTAHSSRTVELETEITVREELQGLEKTVFISNTGEYDCWVRVRAITPPGYQYTYSNDGNWEQIGDYWYYKAQLPVGAVTSSPFKVGVHDLPGVGGGQPAEFNVAIIAECIPCAGVDEVWSAAAWNLQARDAEYA